MGKSQLVLRAFIAFLVNKRTIMEKNIPETKLNKIRDL